MPWGDEQMSGYSSQGGGAMAPGAAAGVSAWQSDLVPAGLVAGTMDQQGAGGSGGGLGP